MLDVLSVLNVLKVLNIHKVVKALKVRKVLKVARLLKELPPPGDGMPTMDAMEAMRQQLSQMMHTLQTRQAKSEPTLRRVMDVVAAVLAEYVSQPLDVDRDLHELGLSSLDGMEIVSELNDQLGTRASPMLMLEATSVRAMATVLLRGISNRSTGQLGDWAATQQWQTMQTHMTQWMRGTPLDAGLSQAHSLSSRESSEVDMVRDVESTAYEVPLGYTSYQSGAVGSGDGTRVGSGVG